MANKGLPSVQACMMRVARLDEDGSVAGGVNSMYVTDAFTSLSAGGEVEAGDEITVKNACGGICVSYKDCDRLKRLNIELHTCAADPELHELLVGGNVLRYTPAGKPEGVGYGYPALNASGCPFGVSIELWSRHIDSTGAPDSDYPWLWWVFPRVYLQIGDKNFENDAMDHVFTGFAVENQQWGDGPNNDWPVAMSSVGQFIPTDDIPEAAIGYQSALAS